jgi:hypothetical protein
MRRATVIMSTLTITPPVVSVAAVEVAAQGRLRQIALTSRVIRPTWSASAR